MNILMGPEETNFGNDDEIPPIRYELRRIKKISKDDFW